MIRQDGLDLDLEPPRMPCSWLPDFRIMRQITADAPVTLAKPEVCAVINGPIGVMRARLRAWLTEQ